MFRVLGDTPNGLAADRLLHGEVANTFNACQKLCVSVEHADVIVRGVWADQAETFHLVLGE